MPNDIQDCNVLKMPNVFYSVIFNYKSRFILFFSMHAYLQQRKEDILSVNVCVFYIK